MNPQDISQTIAKRLEAAWNAGDGAAFGAEFAPDADFVNVRGELHSGEAIAIGHQQIFDTIYAGSTVAYDAFHAREVGDLIVCHLNATLQVPGGPLAGTHTALATVVLVRDGDEHRFTAFHNTLVAGAS
jgi:uncharacterized protein (TIGR02246 family)